MNAPALCQCLKCLRYVARDRDLGFIALHHHWCVECGGDLPLAQLREALTDPLSVELLGLMTEECGEVSQRIGKILRWGWEADFEGTTQQHKLETELGDVLAAMLLLVHNGLVTRQGVQGACVAKMRKFWADANGPRQRLQVAVVPSKGFAPLTVAGPGESGEEAIRKQLETLLRQYCRGCGNENPCSCSNDE